MLLGFGLDADVDNAAGCGWGDWISLTSSRFNQNLMSMSWSVLPSRRHDFSIWAW